MDRCHENDELLLDFLYGLLEPGQVEGLQEHLAQCAVCRESLSVAQRRRRLFARAAQVYDHIPEYKLTADDTAADTAATIESARQTLPFSARPRRRWGLWISAAAAAAVLIAIFAVQQAYERGLGPLQSDLAAAHKKIEANATLASQLQSNLEKKQKDVESRLAAQALHLVALGPTVLEGSAQIPIRVLVENVQGKARGATVQVRLIEDGTQKTLFEKVEVAAMGMAAFQLPPLPIGTGGTGTLSISAITADGAQSIEEKVRLAGSSLVTHLAMNKPAYSPGELLFFRTVTLERFSLRPTAEKLRLQFVLRDAAGKPVKQFFGTTGLGGIAGGEIALAENMPAGEYSLEISEATQTGRMPLVRRRLHVSTEAARKPERKVDSGVHVDFFPEGGELVAGIESRVYYRVRNSQGEPADFAGKLYVGSSAVSSFKPGPAGCLGVFAFTAKAGETYQAKVLRVKDGAVDVASAVSVPCRLNELVREHGIVLSAPAAGVGRDGEALRLEVHNTATEKTLLAVAMCRGRIVDQQLFIAKPGKTEIELNPIPGAHGVIRMTLCEGDRPLAERLVYRPSTQRLQFSVKRKPDRSPFGGQRTELQIQGTNEQGEKAHAWLLAYIADAKIARKPGAELGAHFYLAGELDGPEDLERTDLVAGDTPEALEAIDLFLGTHGWRRFVRTEKSSPALATGEGKTPSSLALFCRENDSLAKLQGRMEQELAQAQAALRKEGSKERARLLEERQQAESELRLAATLLSEYRNRPQAWLRMGSAFMVCLLLAAGVLCLAWGFVQVARRRLATPAFASAAASLGVCLFLYGLAGHLPEPQTPPGGAMAGRGGLPEIELPAAALARSSGAAFPIGYLHGLAPTVVAQKLSVARPTDAPGVVQIAALDLKLRYQQALDREKGAPPSISFPKGDAIKQPIVAPNSLKRKIEEKKSEVKVIAKKENAKPSAPADLFAREYAFRQVKKDPGFGDLILWSPIVTLQKGSGQVTFDLPADVSSVRMFLYGHSADGRFGFHEERWDVKPKN